MLFLLGNDGSALERVVRLSPLRTGVAAPDWLVLGAHMDVIGAGGLMGGG
jgi:hypothetical protein